jgi:HSP20 family protein
MLAKSNVQFRIAPRIPGWDHYGLFANTFGVPNMRVEPRFPAINVLANEDGVIVSAKLPGVIAENIDISVKENTVTIAGTRETRVLEEGQKFLRRERRDGDFSRTFRLPFAVDSNGVEAIFENGVLSVSLPRAEEDKPRKIQVKTA